MYDVAIVGSGIGGSFLASALRGLNIAVIEKDRKVLPKDSGIVSTSFEKLFPARHFIKNRITRMNLVSPSGNEIEISSKAPFAYILKREMFLDYMRSRAMRSADFINGFVKSVEYRDDYYSVNVNGESINAKFLVGCDGANSFVRKSLGIADPKMVFGLMVRTDSVMEGEIRVFFNKYYSPDFFSWVIPQNDEYGLISSLRPKEYLEYFRQKQALGNGTIYGFPMCLGTTKSFANRALLIGDACGQNKPITGGGIMFSMRAAKHAAETIQEAFEKNLFDEYFLSSYERKWKKDYGSEIRRQLLFRKIYRWLTNKDVDGLFRDFGPSLQELHDFDYDEFTGSWKKMPKIKLLSFMVSSVPHLFRKEISG